MDKKAYLISDVEEYGKLISFCINKDVSVWRTYWDEREKGDRCYNIDWQEKRCYYSSQRYYEENGYEIVTPNFHLNEYGEYNIINKKETQGDE